MDLALKELLKTLLSKKCIGGKHLPEDLLLKGILISLTKEGRKGFYRTYKMAINEHWIFRVKKRTGKGSDWHISINPQKLSEIYRGLEEYE